MLVPTSVAEELVSRFGKSRHRQDTSANMGTFACRRRSSFFAVMPPEASPHTGRCRVLRYDAAGQASYVRCCRSLRSRVFAPRVYAQRRHRLSVALFRGRSCSCIVYGLLQLREGMGASACSRRGKRRQGWQGFSNKKDGGAAPPSFLFPCVMAARLRKKAPWGSCLMELFFSARVRRALPALPPGRRRPAPARSFRRREDPS